MMYGYLRLEGPHGRGPIAPQQCGLCARFGQDYRLRTRWLAGDDPSVLALIIESLADDEAPRVRVRCPIPGMRKRRALDPGWPPMRAIAALQLFVAGEKLFDDRVDRDGWLSLLAERLLRKDIGASEVTLRELGFPLDAVRASLRRQPALEADARADIDLLSAPTAEALSTVFAWVAAEAGCEDPAAALFGARLGRALYVTDALADYRRDLRKGAFNPIQRTVGALTSASVVFVEALFRGRIAALDEALAALPLKRNRALVRAATVESLTRRGDKALAALPRPVSLLPLRHGGASQ